MLRPFVTDLSVVRHGGAVVFLVQFQISLAQRFDGERRALLFRLVRPQLELGEHGLAEEGRAEHIQIVGQQIFPDVSVPRRREQMFKQQHFVGRARHLGDEYAVTRLVIAERAVRVQRVHGVAELVRDREDVVRGARIVEQHVRPQP